ncbi:MAG: cell wall-binding repeat-containing protein [Actinomycetota bacterium]|nr:cell wall-binding repeat-containing protein [Actinomycetota bacterium]
MRLLRIVRLALAVALCAGIGMTGPAPAVAAAYPDFTFTGFGWGHGIGMSQWGAKGWAEHGKSWEWISTYYFPGSYLGTIGDPEMSVYLDTSHAFKTSYTLRPSTGKLLTVAGTAGQADEAVTFTAASGKVKATGSKGTSFGTLGDKVRVTTNASPRIIQVAEKSGYRMLENRWYRGDMELRAGTSTVQLRNLLGMEGYIKGVIPGEMGSASWDMDALKTQAVMARSYAYYAYKVNRAVECDTDDQVYVGYSSENDTLNSAVDGTAGKVVKHSKAPSTYDNVVQTFFHSSSGGHTAKIENIWTGTGFPSTSYPYFGGVDDPYCDDAGSPNDPWPSVTKDGMQIAKAIAPKITGEPSGAGSTVWVKSISIYRFPDSGFVNTVTLTWSNGAKSTGVGGYTLSSALGLKSRKYYVGVPYDRIAYSDRYTTAVEVSRNLYPTGSLPQAVVIANGADAKYADSLTASGLAGLAKGPVLLVYADALTKDMISELTRLKGLGATKAYIVGGTASVKPVVASTIASVFGSANVERLAGSTRYGTDRYGTAASVAMKMKALGADGSMVLVASGEKWTDAAIASATSAGSGRPVVLIASSRLPAGSGNVLRDLGATQCAVFGGPNTIGDAAMKQLLAVTGETAPAKRFGTTGTRYDVAVQAARWCQSSFGFVVTKVYVATGERFPDSVTGGVLAAANKNPLVLTATSSLPRATELYLESCAGTCERLVIVGGTASVSDEVVRRIAQVLD